MKNHTKALLTWFHRILIQGDTYPFSLPFLKVLLLILVVLSWISAIGAQEFSVPENPLKGRIVFEQKGCITCHAIRGEGGEVGPDLGQKKFYGSFLELASILWNHSPEMLRRMRELNLPFPRFDRNEMVELMAYLYYLRYLGEPGDLYRGKILVEEKGCLECHSIGGEGGEVAPAFDSLGKYISPLYLAQALWNHGPDMEEQMQEMGLRRPKFQSGEIVDLNAYIRAASKGTERSQIYMSPGNPQRGEQVFKEKGCPDCHSINGNRKQIGPNLQKLEWDDSVTEIAGLMWNHGAVMREYMKNQKFQWPEFTGKEMADLIAFIYFFRFADETGNPEKGKEIYSQKQCARCHDNEAKGSSLAPDLTGSNALSSRIDFAQIMWNHAPAMEEKMSERVVKWPVFTGREMRDLYAYLSKVLKSENQERIE